MYQTEPPLNRICLNWLERQYPAQGNEPDRDDTALLLSFSRDGRKVDMRKSQPGADASDEAEDVAANVDTF